MSDREELVKQFSDVTGVSEDRAKFYLEAANGELQVALSSFYEGDNEGERSAPVVLDDDDSDDDNVPMDSVHLSRSDAKSKAKKAPQSSNIATLASLNDSSSDDEEEQGQAFYAGGSERSGQQVLGPPKKNPIKDYVSEIFRSAQQGNLDTFDVEGSPSSSSSLYAGTGYRLGQTDNDHQAIPDRQRASGRDSEHEVVTLTLWRQGFSINDGELRRYEDSANKEFFESIMRGEIPAELRSKGPTMIHLDLQDNRHEDYVKRSAPFKAFAGSGQSLGSPAPNVVQSSPSASEGNNEENEKKASTSLSVDETQPTTNLQIRLADGSRLSARFNQSHTIDNVRQYITNARPQYAAQNFALMTTFPPKELADGSQSLKDAGLLNAAIMQRMK